MPKYCNLISSRLVIYNPYFREIGHLSWDGLKKALLYYTKNFRRSQTDLYTVRGIPPELGAEGAQLTVTIQVRLNILPVLGAENSNLYILLILH